MREQALDEVRARQFLLGELPPEEEGQIQELAFQDCDTFAFLESVENDLIDEFIQGDLSSEEEERFESHFLSQPGSRNNLKTSQVLQRHLDRIEDVPRPRKFSLILGWSIAVAAVLLIALLAAIIVFVRQGRQSSEIETGSGKPIVTPSQQLKISPSLTPTTSPPPYVENKPKSLNPEKQKRPAIYALLSPSALARGEGAQELSLPSNGSSMTIELALITQGKFTTYEATLENEGGTVLDRWSDLRKEVLTSGEALKIEVRTALLKPHEFYRVVVSGASSAGKTEEIARYPFETK